MPPRNTVDSRRDNFSAQVVRTLAERSGGKCAICRAPTWGPNDSQFKSTNIGQAAHITAAAPGGPRYDPNISPQTRSSALNGIWLCANCHTIIDKNVQEYPVEKLRDIKKKAESEAKAELGVAAKKRDALHDNSPITIATSATAIMEIRKVKASLKDLMQDQEPQTHPSDLLEKLKYINVVNDSYLPVVGSELVQFYKLLVIFDSKQHTWLQVVRLLDEITTAYLPSLTQNDIDATCEIIAHVMENQAKRPSKDRKEQYQSTVVFLSHLAQRLKERKNLKNTAADNLKQLLENVRPKRKALDETDTGDIFGNQTTVKLQTIEGAGEPNDWTFISTMCDLHKLTDEERRMKEEMLEKEGFLTYII